MKQDTTAHSKHSDVRITIQPNTFSAHTADLPSAKQIEGFWNPSLLTKHSEETLQVLGKAICFDFFQDGDNNSSNQDSFH